jgi:hypothetical protein
VTNQQILTKAIQKAIDGGWKGEYLGKLKIWQQDNGIVRIKNNLDEEWAVEEIIYNKAFAKALWGEDKEMFCIGDSKVFFDVAWKEHLRRMVIADDPIAYLGEHI